MNIVLIHAADKGHGAERAVMTLHKSLLALGHRSRLLVGSKRGDEPEVYEIPRERAIPGLLRITRWMERRLGWQNFYAPWFRNLHRVIGRDVDVVHLHSLWTMTYGYADLTGIARLARRYPTVITLHDAWMLTGHCACPIRCQRWLSGCGKCPDLARQAPIARDSTAFNWKRKWRAVQRSPLHVTAVSTWLKNQVHTSPIFERKPVHVVHNSVDTSVFHPGDRAEARRELGAPPNAKVVLLAGQAIEGIRQGIAQHAAHALNRLTERGITALLVGHSAERVAETIKGASVVLPFQDTPEAMARCYRAADLTVVPSEYETFGLVAAESVCCGTPVVAFATGGLTDVIQPGICGWLAPTGNTEELAAAISQAFDRPEELSRLRASCVDSGATRFSTAAIANAYQCVYRAAKVSHAAQSDN